MSPNLKQKYKTMSGSTFDFDEISKNIHKNHKQHEKQIKENWVKRSVITLTDLYDNYQQEIKEINSEITPSKDDPTVEDFADIFKAFEEYPSNLQKPRRLTTTQQQRMNCTMALARDITLMTNSREQSPSGATSLPNLMRSAAELPTATEIYNDFRKFQQKLAQFLSETQEQEDTKAYEKRLEQLCAFGKQLEKLRPTMKDVHQAFTSEEEEKLQKILVNLEELNFIRENQEVFANGAPTINGQTARTDSFMHLITYLLNTVSNV